MVHIPEKKWLREPPSSTPFWFLIHMWTVNLGHGWVTDLRNLVGLLVSGVGISPFSLCLHLVHLVSLLWLFVLLFPPFPPSSICILPSFYDLSVRSSLGQGLYLRVCECISWDSLISALCYGGVPGVFHVTLLGQVFRVASSVEGFWTPNVVSFLIYLFFFPLHLSFRLVGFWGCGASGGENGLLGVVLADFISFDFSFFIISVFPKVPRELDLKISTFPFFSSFLINSLSGIRLLLFFLDLLQTHIGIWH